MKRYICIHGHFYQPPRESPWTGQIERQPSAHPYHDWNERITVECYEPNTKAKILDPAGKAEHIYNNYSRMSFDFGPTLLSWLEEKHPAVHDSIIEADRLSQANFSGHGSAMAQAYNHMIMPLADPRDKETQVMWGIRDFEYRFQRLPEGMWLPETAVDTETLEVLARHGIRFTILAPRQAKRIRLAGRRWHEVSEQTLNTSRPYRCVLPSGQTIDIFFYHGPVSLAVAFEGLLHNGEHFAKRLKGAFPKSRRGNPLMHVATDGESYGHHHKFGEMALAYALYYIEKDRTTELTVYGDYLQKYPPKHEVEIIEFSSWSCAHGVERWRSNCGCNVGGNAQWNQKWRAPLREALDWLRDKLVVVYEEAFSGSGCDPWVLRNEYIRHLLDPKNVTYQSLIPPEVRSKFSEGDFREIFMLLEMQKFAMFMYTSCGWFFDDVSGIEAMQVLQYAARAIELAKAVSGRDFEPGFIDKLKSARSNIKEKKDAAHLYKQMIISQLRSMGKTSHA